MPRPGIEPGTLTYKVNALQLSYLGRQPVNIFSLRKPDNEIRYMYTEYTYTEYTDSSY